MIEAFLAVGDQDRATRLLKIFLIGGAEEVQIISGSLPIPKQLLKYLVVGGCKPETATLCWVPPPPAATKARTPGKTAQRRVLVPA